MPEIAEVRTVAKTLNERISGRTIKSIQTPYDKIIEGDKKDFIENILNETIQSVSNNGKWLYINLTNNLTILSHLRMEGKYFIKDEKEPIEKHEHIIFHLDNKTDLRYHDTRKFGRMILVKTNEINDSKEIKKLGIEPDSDNLSKEYIYNHIKNKNIPIKTLLLDQTIINGLGNIYVDEVLFKSKINPNRLGKNITLEECENIKKSAKEIINKATKYGGTTIRSYTSSLGVKGNYQDFLNVHTKEGEKCPICESTILKTRIGGRGTYYCDNCQK